MKKLIEFQHKGQLDAVEHKTHIIFMPRMSTGQQRQANHQSHQNDTSPGERHMTLELGAHIISHFFYFSISVSMSISSCAELKPWLLLAGERAGNCWSSL